MFSNIHSPMDLAAVLFGIILCILGALILLAMVITVLFFAVGATVGMIKTRRNVKAQSKPTAQ